MPSAVLSSPIVAADWLRRRWLRMLGSWARPLMVDREFRVACMFAAIVCSVGVATLLLPLWLLILGPLVWGVPHLVADLRYLVLRPGYHRRPLLWLAVGVPLVWTALGGNLVWGFVAAGAAALLARTAWRWRVVALALWATVAAGLAHLGQAADIVFAHAHNFIAVLLWWLWRPRQGRQHWLALALFVGVCLFLCSDTALDWAGRSGGLSWFGGGMSLDYQAWRLSPGLSPDLGVRLVLLFCFAQAIHYAVWLQLLPDEDRQRVTPPTFRTSVRDLRRDLGTIGLTIAVVLCAGLAVWAVWDLMRASHGYFRMARFHGHLEVVAGTLLVLERRVRGAREPGLVHRD